MYTNDMRYAIRALKNPTQVPIAISDKEGQLLIVVEKSIFDRLSEKGRNDFKAYVKQVKSIISLGGGGEVEVYWK